MFSTLQIYLYSNTYMSSHFKYKSVIHLEFILMYGMRGGPNVIFL